MFVGGRAGRLNNKDIAPALILIDLEIKLAVREAFSDGPAHITTQMPGNLFRQFRVCVSRKNLDAASCAHNQTRPPTDDRRPCLVQAPVVSRRSSVICRFCESGWGG